MDTFSHMLIAFLLVGKFDITLGVFAGFMALFLDLDVLLFPLAKKYPVLEHRGITHSIPATLIYTTVISTIFTLITGLNFLLVLGAGLTGSLMHILGDSITTYGLGAFWPFRKKYIKLDIILGIDPLLIIISIPSLLLFHVSYQTNDFIMFNTIFFIAGVYLITYVLIRLILKLTIYFKFKTKSLPTLNWFKFKLISESDQKKGDYEYKELQWQKYNLITKNFSPKRTFLFPKINPAPPLATDDQLIAYSHKLKPVQRIFRPIFYHICEIIRRTKAEAQLFWSSVEHEYMGALVSLKRDGTYKFERIYPYKRVK